MNKTTLYLSSLHLKEFVRQPEVLFWALLFPILIAWALGLAFSNQDQIKYTIALVGDVNTKVRNFDLCSQSDQSQRAGSVTAPKKISSESKHGSKQSEKTFECLKVQSIEEAYELLRKGRINLFIQMEPNDINQQMTFYFDPQNSEAEMILPFLEK